MLTQAKINQTIWSACDSFRGTVDSSTYKDYILTMLFLKYISDVYREHEQSYTKQYNNDKTMVERALKRERFVLSDISKFSYIYGKRNESSIGQIINIALNKIEEDNKGKLEAVFRDIDFNSNNLGDPKNKNAVLKSLLEVFNGLDLRPSNLEGNDVIGDCYEFLIYKFASNAGKKAGEFYTPSMVSELIARLVKPKENDLIYDPACGSGSLLLRAHKKVPNGKTTIYGQEMNGQTRALARMNMFLHGVDDAKIEWGDTLANPQFTENGKLKLFQIVIANPPFSLDQWAKGFAGPGNNDDKFKMEADYDTFGRFKLGVPPSSKGDYAFILHMLHSLADGGRMGVVVPHGVLFRGSSEGKIREQLIKLNLLEAVIGLPANLFFGTSIPACILIFKKDRARKEVLFIDASGDGNYEKVKNQNILRETDIQKILDTYNNFSEIEKYSHVATPEEIAENDYNLNIPRYVDTFEEEEIIDIEAVNADIKSIKAELSEVEMQMAKYLKELGLE